MNNLPAPWQNLASSDDATIAAELDRLTINVRRTNEECWLDYRYPQEQHIQPLGDAQQSLRILLNHGDRPIHVTPQLADRPVVARPMVPTEVPPKERATLFISAVLWARVGIGEQLLAELPTLRLSDTWFGATTMSGELCYASQTRALLRLDNVPYSAFRAIIPVTIDNQGEDNVKLERINVPVPHLTLYCDGEKFWTSALTILRETNLATAKLRIDATPPPHSIIAAAPRRPIRGGVFDRAVDLLFA